MILFFYFLFLNKISFGQEISKEFDSIISLSSTIEEKLSLFDTLFKTYEKNNNFKQLGDESHELAKKIYKKDLNKSVFFNELAIASKLKVKPLDSCSLKKSYYNAGFYNKKNKAFKKAIEGYKKVLQFDNCDDFNANAKRNLAQSYLRLAVRYFEAKDYFLASLNYEEALNNFNSNNKVDIINTHLDVAKAYKNIRNKEAGKKAINHLHTADSLYNLLAEKQDQAEFTIYNNLAGLYSLYGTDSDKTFLYYDKADKVLKRLNDPNQSQLFYLNLGFTYEKIDLKKSKMYFEKSLEFKEANQNFLIRTYIGLGINASLSKDYKTAQSYFLKSLSHCLNIKQIKETDAISDQQLIQVQDKEVLLELFRSQIENWDRWAAEKPSKEITKLILDKAITSDRLVNLMLKEDLSFSTKLLLRDLASEIYILALEACYQSKDVERAFYYAEKNKALLLIEDVRKQNELKKDTTSVSVKNYFKNPIQTKIRPLDDVQLNEDEIILHYVMAERLTGEIPDTYLIFLSKEQKKVLKIKAVEKLISNVQLLREKLEKPFTTTEDITSYKEVSNSIYNTLIPNEIQNELGNKKITVLGDHIINFIPFEALVINSDTIKYFIENNEISYDYSLTFLKENENIVRDATKQFLGIAPENFTEDLASLKNSGKEIELGEKFYSGDLLKKDKASKDSFIKNAKDYKIIHLATHADASDDKNPWIAFNDQKVNLQELNSISNNADLVVLSACNTSLGKISRGEGVMSLARSFFSTGAKAVIPSLWSTNDKATTEIIANFYENLSKGKTKSIALREAKLNYLQSNSDSEASPYYWAPLIVIGNSNGIEPQSNYLLVYIFIGLVILLLGFFLLKKKS
ncbi:CHAT domain-containing protein [Tenacibaculum jejuense]|nr:CHAT domain-containing protein [Tenacibaculum jejuense]